jgi:hypothetical protein
MSKNKMLYLISERNFEHIQKISIVAYKITLDNDKFNFDLYFENNYKNIIEYALEYLKIDPEKYKEVYYKYFKEVSDLSEKCGIQFLAMDMSIRKEVFNYWKINNKNFLKDIMDIYSN